MANTRLANRCAVCGSSIWCGRTCANAPKPADVCPPPTPEVKAARKAGGSTYRSRDPEKRRAYQRDLMRKKRQAT